MSKAEAAHGRHVDIALIKLTTMAKAEAARGRHADDKPTTPDFDNDSVCDFAVDAATGPGVPCDGVRAKCGACTGSVIVEASVGGGPWDDVVADDDGELDIELDIKEAVRQNSFVAPRDSGDGVSVNTDVLNCQEDSSSPPAPDDARATGRTYEHFTKSPPPYFRCVVSPLSSLSSITRPPVHCRATTAFFCRQRRD